MRHSGLVAPTTTNRPSPSRRRGVHHREEDQPGRPRWADTPSAKGGTPPDRRIFLLPVRGSSDEAPAGRGVASGDGGGPPSETGFGRSPSGGGRYARLPPRPRIRHGCSPPPPPLLPSELDGCARGTERRLRPPPRRSLHTLPPRSQTAGGLRGGRGRVRRRAGWDRRLGRLTAGAHLGNGGQQWGTRHGSVAGGEQRRRRRR